MSYPGLCNRFFCSTPTIRPDNASDSSRSWTYCTNGPAGGFVARQVSTTLAALRYKNLYIIRASSPW